MSTKRMNWKARRYLLTGRTDGPACWDVWAVKVPPSPNREVTAHFFRTAPERSAWIAENPRNRRAVGKRHPAVKAARTQKASEDRALSKRWGHLDPAVQWSLT